MALLSTLNSQYTAALSKRPLSTKAATLVVLALLNEQLASVFAGESPFTTRVPLMGLFAGVINAPLSHYGYMLIQKLVPAPLNKRKRILQILLSTGVITPIFCACFVVWVGLINNVKQLKTCKSGQELVARMRSVITSALVNNYVRVSTTSVLTSPLFMLAAQKWIRQDAWAVFFALCYFVLGTYNNTKVKLMQKKKREECNDKYEDKKE